MKNLVNVVNGLVDAMFEDIAHTDLVTSECLIKTRYDMYHAFAKRGLPFYTITMPSCSKFLESFLENGEMKHERPPYHGGITKDDQRPRFLHSLWARISSDSGQLLAEPCPKSIFFLRQVYNLFKKLDMDCKQVYVDNSVKDWLHIENELPRSHQDTWDSENPVWSLRSGHPLWGDSVSEKDPSDLFLNSFSGDEHRGLVGSFQNWQRGAYNAISFDPNDPIWNMFRRLCRHMCSQLGPLDTWSLRPKHGPGAVSERGVVRKYEFNVWPRKLQNVFPADWFASHDLTDRSISDKEPPARMCAVPKTQKGPRLIAAEPSAHQWIQGGIQRWLEDRVAASALGKSIDFRSQLPSRELAIEASSTGQFATVDLSSASDRLSTRLVECVFEGHADLLDALHACRSRALKVPKGLTSFHTSDELVVLRKFGPQGSAVTFPIQTIVYTMLSHAALAAVMGNWGVRPSDWNDRAQYIRVFGDDIIIHRAAVGHLYQLLEEVGLKVNKEKSFYKGQFRESCGMDAFDGVDVTPGYIRQIYQPSSPEALVSVVECSNNLYRKGLWHTADRLLKTVPPAELKALPVSRQAIGPLSLFTYVEQPLLAQRRWNGDLHIWEYRYLTVRSKQEVLDQSGEASLLQFFTEEPDPMLPWKSGQARKPRLRKTVAWVDPYQVAEEA